MIIPAPLQVGDTVLIVATARKISRVELSPAIVWLEQMGIHVELPPNLFAEDHQLAGDDLVRQASLQWCLDHPKAKAIWCARGGYGTARILDGLEWSKFSDNPKWIVGYSDITALHGQLQQMGFASIHGTMPINVPSNTDQALTSLWQALKNEPTPLSAPQHHLNIEGDAEGVLVGGNLSVLYSTLGSSSEPPLKDVILFMEDLDEYLYHIDRMMLNLTRNGWWNKVAGVVVGGMTDMNDNTIPFGSTAEETIHKHIQTKGLTLGFGFSAGHMEDNRALTFGKKVRLSVGISGSSLTYL